MTLKKLLYKILIAGTATTVVLLTSCQSGNKPVIGQKTVKDSLNLKEISQDVKEVVYPLPTPFEMIQMLNDMGAKYVSGSLNPVSNVEKYFTEKSKAVNLGVYGADLAYAATYDQKQDVRLYSKALKSLIDELGINIDYKKMLTDEFREKINNKDTLAKIITNTFSNTYKYLYDKSNPDLAIMMVSGMWVELMYIATHISEETYDNTNWVRIIAKQKDSYEKLLKILNSHNSNTDIKEMETKLLLLKPAFDKVESGLQEKDYQLILTTVKSIRKKSVS
jgi:hypothetical protein